MRIMAELFPARETKSVELPEGSSGYELMKRLDLAVDVHILVQGDAPIPVDETLRDGEQVRVIAVVSGG